MTFFLTFKIGNEDLICNYYGTASYLSQMVWPGQQNFAKASNHTWTVQGQAAGSVRSYGGLTFIVVYNAGHMVKNRRKKKEKKKKEKERGKKKNRKKKRKISQFKYNLKGSI